jgi:hypothetical protein
MAKQAFDSASSLANDERQWVEAIFCEVTASWTRAAELYSKLWQRNRDFETAIRLAHVQTLGGLPEKALETISQIPAPGSDDPRVIFEKATAQRFLGKFDEEIKTLRPIISDHPDEDLVRATALAEKCWADYNSRDLNEPLKIALDDCQQAENIFNDREDALGQARTLTREALIVSDKDNKAPDFSKGMDLQKRAIEIAHERSAIRDEAGGRQNLANILMEQTSPDPESARTEYEKSEQMFNSLGDKAGMAGVSNDQAVRLIDLCRYQDALNSAKRARQNWHDIGSADEAIALANQGSMEFFLGDLADAETELKAALSMADAQRLNVDRDNWPITLGEIYADEGKLLLAEQCYKEGPCYDNKQPSTVHKAEPLTDAIVDYAALQIVEKKTSEAERLAQSALTDAKAENDPDDEAWARVVLANALLAEGKNGLLNPARNAVTGIAAIRPKDCRVGVAAGLTLARIEGRSGNPDGQKENLTRVLQTAHSLGLLGYMFEATLDQAEADLRAGRSSAARQEAEQVLGQSSDRGFQQIKVKASELVSRAKVGATVGN